MAGAALDPLAAAVGQDLAAALRGAALDLGYELGPREAAALAARLRAGPDPQRDAERLLDRQMVGARLPRLRRRREPPALRRWRRAQREPGPG